eukprot:2569156-Rhodomonas_salina.1
MQAQTCHSRLGNSRPKQVSTYCGHGMPDEPLPLSVILSANNFGSKEDLAADLVLGCSRFDTHQTSNLCLVHYLRNSFEDFLELEDS